MRKTFVIGVIHNFVPKKDLIELLEKYNPDQVMVEITASDLKKKKFKNYGKEFKDAYEWCKKKKVKIDGFDYWQKGWLQLEDMPESEKKEYKKIEKLLVKIFKRYGWKKFNKKKYKKLLDKYIDKAKKSISYIKEIYETLPIRQKKMLANVKKRVLKKGTILILTGVGHLGFFEKHLKAEFPYRKAVGTHQGEYNQ